MVDYHVHTNLCGHASGSMDEYCAAAARAGVIEIGFADHAPMPKHLRHGLSMMPEETEGYLRAAEELRERYADAGRVIVRIGFEVDFPLFDSFDRRYLSDPRVDFLIGSSHFIDGWAFDHPDHADEWRDRNVDEVYSRYFSFIHDMAQSRLFDVVGHFDLVKKFGHRPKKDFTMAVTEIAGILGAAGTAVEINTAGLTHRAEEQYPSERILGILFDHNVPITIGSDAHDPSGVGRFFSEAADLAKRVGYRAVSGFSQRRRYDIPL